MCGWIILPDWVFLSIILNFKTHEVEWDSKVMSIHEPGYWEVCQLEDIQAIIDECDHMEGLTHGGKSMMEELLVNGMKDDDHSQTDLENHTQQL